MKNKERKNIQDPTRRNEHSHKNNVYGNMVELDKEPTLARSIEIEASTTMDYDISYDLYVNVDELKEEADLKRSKEKEKTPKTMKASTSKTTKARLILAALIFLFIMFLFLIVITSLLLKFYLAMNEEMSHLKNHASHFRKISEEEQSDLKNKVANLSNTMETLCTLCPVGWSAVGSSCYFVSGVEMTWDNARDECYKMNSVLVMIKDKTESDSLNTLYNKDRRYWIGLRRDPREVYIWKWLDWTQVTFTNWAVNEPNYGGKNEDCGETISGPWNDRVCSDKLFYICKRIRTC